MHTIKTLCILCVLTISSFFTTSSSGTLMSSQEITLYGTVYVSFDQGYDYLYYEVITPQQWNSHTPSDLSFTYSLGNYYDTNFSQLYQFSLHINFSNDQHYKKDLFRLKFNYYREFGSNLDGSGSSTWLLDSNITHISPLQTWSGLIYLNGSIIIGNTSYTNITKSQSITYTEGSSGLIKLAYFFIPIIIIVVFIIIYWQKRIKQNKRR